MKYLKKFEKTRSEIVTSKWTTEEIKILENIGFEVFLDEASAIYYSKLHDLKIYAYKHEVEYYDYYDNEYLWADEIYSIKIKNKKRKYEDFDDLISDLKTIIPMDINTKKYNI